MAGWREFIRRLRPYLAVRLVCGGVWVSNRYGGLTRLIQIVSQSRWVALVVRILLQ